MYLHIGLVDYVQNLLGPETDVRVLHLDVAFGEVHVPVVGLPHDRDERLQVVVIQHSLVLVLSSLLREKFDYDLFVVSRLQNALSFIAVESGRHVHEPLCRLLSQISNYDWFLCDVLNWTVFEIQLVGEVTLI